MLERAYLAAGAALLLVFAVAAWRGWEWRGAEQRLPTPGVALAASSVWWRSSGGSHWYSSSSRSGGAVFGGK